MKLTIPSLVETQQNFKKYASVYDSFDEVLCDNFFNNDAKKLQELLIEFDNNMQSSYLERLWNRAYLNTRKPLSIASNFSFKLPTRYELNDFIYTFAKLVRDYDRGVLEYKTPRGEPLFPRQFDILKGGARVPKLGSDEFKVSYKQADYITILHNNHLYKAPVLEADPKGVYFEFKQEKQPISFAHLGFCNSDQAAHLYKKYEDYNAFFEVIENSRFNICIINQEFDNLSQEQAYMLYHAPCYHFKTLNFIYNESSKNIYLNAEHSFLDGGTIAYILEYIANHLESPTEFVQPVFINQYFDSSFEKEIEVALGEYTGLSQNQSFSVQLSAEKSKDFSKDFIMQAAIAYGASFVYKRYVCQYEAVDVREFDYGRTECVRVISHELVKAFRTFHRDDLLSANTEHKTRIKACKKAKGIDRHLYGLSNFIPCIEDQFAKAFFSSQMYKDTCETIVSTSSLGKNNYLDVFYFQPVCDNGLGVSYGHMDNEYFFSCTYFDEASFVLFKEKVLDFFNRFANMAS